MSVTNQMIKPFRFFLLTITVPRIDMTVLIQLKMCMVCSSLLEPTVGEQGYEVK